MVRDRLFGWYPSWERLMVYPRVLFLVASPTGMLSNDTCCRNLPEEPLSVSTAINRAEQVVWFVNAQLFGTSG